MFDDDYPTGAHDHDHDHDNEGGGGSGFVTQVVLDTAIDDPEVVAALVSRPAKRERDRFVRTALRIGVIALGQAQGRIDGDTVRSEGERLIALLQEQLAGYEKATAKKLTDTLGDYFDPSSGRFPQRVSQLVGQDGELEMLLKHRFSLAQQSFENFIASHVGPDSELRRILTPDEHNAFVRSVRDAISSATAQHSSTLLSEFSLDNANGALSRMVRELAEKHGTAADALQAHFREVMSEFSLDKEDSALSRLVRRVNDAQEKIQAEFTLDSDSSALARMKRELTGLIEEQNRQAQQFQKELHDALGELRGRRDEAARSTAHGHTFEAAVVERVRGLLQGSGDVVDEVGRTTGIKPHCKKGDAVVTLPPDSLAAGARIVLEMKEDASYTLKDSLDEIAEARENRQAGIGVFVHSKKTVHASVGAPLMRHGNDIVVVWDGDAESSDAYLQAALLMAKALAVRARKVADALTADVHAIDKAIAAIGKSLEQMDDITTFATTIRNNAEKILERNRLVKKALDANMEVLAQQVDHLKDAVQSD